MSTRKRSPELEKALKILMPKESGGDLAEVFPALFVDSPKPAGNLRGRGMRYGRIRDRKHDVHDTADVAIKALLRYERPPMNVWEPACGSGSIVRALRDRGHAVFPTDIRREGLIEGANGGIDFLMEMKPIHATVRAVVTNPPYAIANQFIRKAVEWFPYVAMLLSVGFLEGYDNPHRNWLLDDSGYLARVYFFKRRLPRMHREDWQGPKAAPTVFYAWLVWDWNHKGPATMHRITWEEELRGDDKTEEDSHGGRRLQTT
jgi:hypothetical protein